MSQEIAAALRRAAEERGPPRKSISRSAGSSTSATGRSPKASDGAPTMPADAARCAITRSGRPLVIDLFAGVGMWSLGMERAGFAAVAACEIDPWKRAVYARHFPRARLYDDVRELTGNRLRADGIFPAVIVGSPPCKEYSAANSKGRGIEGDGLFLEFVRLVAEFGPRWACAENSPRIRTKGFDRIAHEFASAGYACRAYVLGADDLRAPHIRKRAWIVANRADADCPRQLQPEGVLRHERGWTGDAIAGYWDASDAALAAGPALASRHVADAAAGPARGGFIVDRLRAAIGERAIAWNGGPGRYLGVVDGLAGGMARRVAAAAGDGILPQIAEAIGRALIATDPELADRRAV